MSKYNIVVANYIVKNWPILWLKKYWVTAYDVATYIRKKYDNVRGILLKKWYCKCSVDDVMKNNFVDMLHILWVDSKPVEVAYILEKICF